MNNTKILHTDNNIQKLNKILEALYIKFRQPIINRINCETSDNILKYLKWIEQSIITKDKTDFILIHVTEIFEK